MRGPDGGLERGLGDRLVLQERLHDGVVVVGDGLDQAVAVIGRELAELTGGRLLLPLHAERVDVAHGLHAHEVDDAFEAVLRADRHVHGDRVGAEAVDHRLHRVEEVGADAIHLVDERDPRHGVLVGLAPDGLGLRLDAGDGVEHGDRAIEHAQRPLHLDGEVHVPGRIDDVDSKALPERGRGGGGDGDPPLLLLDHPVHGRGTLVHLAELVRAPGVVEDSLRGRGLAGIDVGHDADVPDQAELVRLRDGAGKLRFDDCHGFLWLLDLYQR